MSKEQKFILQTICYQCRSLFYSARADKGYRDNFQNKSVSSSLKWVSNYILVFAKLIGGERGFFEQGMGVGCSVRLHPGALDFYQRLKNLSFCEI